MPARLDDVIDPALLNEAAAWMVRLREDDGDALAEEIECWRARSPAHSAAWRRAETLLRTFERIPPGLGRAALTKPVSASRRRALQTLGLSSLGLPALWLAWQFAPWSDRQADYVTATGEQRHLKLPDGGHFVLNTASAVDVRFSAAERRIILRRGEILVTTGSDAALLRPFLVETPHGTLRALGTRFSVRHETGSTQLAVFDGQVEINTRTGQTVRLRAGKKTAFSPDVIAPVAATGYADDLWANGMLVANDMPLRALLAELARYRSGYLGCVDAVAGLAVSGAFPLDDIGAALALLLQTRPLAMRHVTPYWVRLEPAHSQE